MTGIWAHRGTHGDHTREPHENSLEAFRAARRLGADGVELDVRRSADGTLVVHHDAVVPGIGPIACVRAARLPAHVPSLTAALDACRGLVVDIEVKNSVDEVGYEADQGIARDIAAAVCEAGLVGDAVISSFAVPAIDAVRAAAPDLAVGWLLAPMAIEARAALSIAARRGYQAIHPFVSVVDEPLVRAASDLGVKVHVWTVNARSEIRRMARLGVDAIITDDVALALEVAGPAGATPGVVDPAGATPGVAARRGRRQE